jgi:hypothetical protein
MLLLSFFFLNQQRVRLEPATTATTEGEAEGSEGRNGAKSERIKKIMRKISEESKTQAGTTESEQNASEIDTALKSEHSAKIKKQSTN